MLTAMLTCYFLADLTATIWAREFMPSGWRRFVVGTGLIAALDRIEAAHNTRSELIASFKKIGPGQALTVKDSTGDSWSVMWTEDLEHALGCANLCIRPGEAWTYKPKVRK